MLRNEILSKIPFSVRKKCYSRNLSIYNSWLSTTGRQTLRQFFYARKNSNLDSFKKESKWSDNLLGHVYSCLQISSKVGIKYFVSQINISTRRSGKWFVLSLKRIRIDILDIMIDMELATNLFIIYGSNRANFVQDILFSNFSSSLNLWSCAVLMTYPFLYPNPRLTLKNFCLRHQRIEVVGKGSLSANPKLAKVCSCPDSVSKCFGR